MGNSSVTVKTQRTTRDLLATFANNQRLVKLFENLALDVSETIPDAMDRLQQDSDSVRFLAMLVQAVADGALALAQQATEGPPRAETGEQADDVSVSSPQIFEGFAVGMIAITVDPTNPAQTLGYGVWVAWGSGRFPVSYLALDADFGTVEATGGAKTKAISAHAGTAVADHASHTHTFTQSANTATPDLLAQDLTGAGVAASGTTAGPSATLSHTVTQPSAHDDLNVLPPFIVAFFWKRTA